MRIVFSALSLLVVVAIIGMLARKQLAPAAATSTPTSAGVVAPTGTPKQQVEQVRQSVENALQQSRPVNDETK